MQRFACKFNLIKTYQYKKIDKKLLPENNLATEIHVDLQNHQDF